MTFLKSIFGGWLRERCFGCDQYVEDCVCHKTDETTGAPGGEGQDSRGVESPAKSGVRLPSPSPTTRSAADHLRALHDIAYCRVFGLPGGDSLSAVQYGRFAKARALDALGMDTNPAPDAAAAPTGHSGTMEVSSTLGDSWDPRNRLVYVFERLEEIMPCTDSNRPIEHHARAVVARYKKMAAELAALKVSLSDGNAERQRLANDVLRMAAIERQSTAYAEECRRALKGLLDHLPENWGDCLVEGSMSLVVDGDAIDHAIAIGAPK